MLDLFMRIGRQLIQETFSTTIGVIRSIDAKDQSLLVDTLRNIILPDVFAKFVKNCVFAKDPRVRWDAVNYSIEC